MESETDDAASYCALYTFTKYMSHMVLSNTALQPSIRSNDCLGRVGIRRQTDLQLLQEKAFLRTGLEALDQCIKKPLLLMAPCLDLDQLQVGTGGRNAR